MYTHKMPKVGAHVSAAVSLELSFKRAKDIGAQCTQIFVSPPQQWTQTPHEKSEVLRYREEMKKCGISSNFIHGTYLINLASDNLDHLKKSIDWLSYGLDLAGKLGMEGVIFHTGSHKGSGLSQTINQITKAIANILNKATPTSDATPYLILENSAGGGNSIGSKLSELGQIIKLVGEGKLKVCLDTCHAYAAGYDVKSPIGLRSTLEEFEQEIGLNNLVAIHANDSKFDLGSAKDRHENIGEGFIGKEGFENIINHPKLKHLPFILEVPGFGNSGSDADNIKILKSLIR